MTKRSVFLGLCIMIAASPAAFAALIVQSTFDTGDEGWRVGDFLATSGDNTPTFVATGGNPGGFIRTGDDFSFNAYQAPASFLGNQSAAYGGSIHLEERVLSSVGNQQAMVVLSNGSLLLQFRTLPPGTSFTAFDIPLVASAGWEFAVDGSAAGAPASEAQLQQVLSNLTLFNIDADWQNGADQVDLDNVRLSSPATTGVPDGGGTLVLLSVSLLGVFGYQYFRQRRLALG